MHTTIVCPALLGVWRHVRGRKYPWLGLLYGGITTVTCVVVAVLLYYDRSNAAVVVILATACAVAVLTVVLFTLGPRFFE